MNITTLQNPNSELVYLSVSMLYIHEGIIPTLPIFLPRKHTRGNRHWRKKLYLWLKPWEWEILLKRTKLTSLQISCMTVSLEFFSVPCQILFIFAIFVFHFYCHGRLRSCKSLEYCFISS